MKNKKTKENKVDVMKRIEALENSVALLGNLVNELRQIAEKSSEFINAKTEIEMNHHIEMAAFLENTMREEVMI